MLTRRGGRAYYVRDSPSDPADWPELSVPSPLGGLPVLSFLSERSLPNRTLRTASGWLAQPILSLRLPLVGMFANPNHPTVEYHYRGGLVLEQEEREPCLCGWLVCSGLLQVRAQVCDGWGLWALVK